jgi:hypothetical protein
LIPGINAGIVDTTMQNNLVTYPGAQINTTATTVKYGSGSMYFNGSSRLLISATPALNLTGNFTIEFWVYFSATLPGWSELVCTSLNGTVGANMTALEVLSNGSLSYYAQGNTLFTSSAGVVTTNTWYHIALVKNGTNQALYVNGTSVASATSSVQPNSGYAWTIGDRIAGAGSGQYPLTGYIDDLRITNGVARYTATFTPPTAAFPDLVPITTTATTTSTLATGYTFSTSTYLGTETWTWNTATNRWFSTQEPSQQYTLTPSLIEDQATTSTGYIDFPYGTTVQRPATPSVGYMRFNTDLGLMEYWNTAGTWVQIPAQNT